MKEQKTSKTIQLKLDSKILAYIRLEGQLQNKTVSEIIENMFVSQFKDKFKIERKLNYEKY